MIVNTLSILAQQGNTLVAEVKRAIEPHKATGRTSASLMFSVRREGDKDILQLTGRSFIMALETGRKSTPQYTKPSRAFVQSIREWLQAKGSDTAPAYAIAKSIHQKGTKGTLGIISGPVNNWVDQISVYILEQFAQQYLFNVVKFASDNRN